MNYYNEWDKGAAAWLRELIKSGLIPNGYVDERSITEVTPSDVEGFTQCHFFAGIGGWSLALQIAGVPEITRIWTGSPPCQPFSFAGKQLGQLDARHLAPTFMRLVAQCRPPVLFGEQVSAAIGKHWLDDLFIELERQGYACGAAVLPACSVGAPHKRDRLFFGASHVVHTYDQQQSATGHAARSSVIDGAGDPFSSLADTNSQQQRSCGGGGACAHDLPAGWEQDTATASGLCRDNAADSHYGFWSDADWLGCRDGKFRSVESGTQPLANGIPARVGRLRGYGNAIVPQVAAEFIKAFKYSTFCQTNNPESDTLYINGPWCPVK